ncbi:MAG: uroporphyrinogen-III synthase [Verrucomicrobia bacterium]|nr:uroporphyrinogen-III synthase [Verrucomicrobiota bacterium]
MKRVLYLGTDPTQFAAQGHFDGHLIHYPVIQIVPKSPLLPELKLAYDDLHDYTHLIFTSKNAVQIFFQHLKELGLSGTILTNKTVIAIGAVTAARLNAHGTVPAHIAEQESQEGLVQLLNKLDIEDAYFFLPRSALSRPILARYFVEREIRFQACDLYDTKTLKAAPVPDLKQIDEIVFTSPSTVKGFMEIFGALPHDKKLLAIGPITENALREVFSS